MSDSKDNRKEHDASVVAILERTQEAANGETTTLGDTVHSLGQESYGALILLPALLAVSPLSGIPTASTILGITIAIVSSQALLGRHSLWFPSWLLSREVDTAKFKDALSFLEKPAGVIDRYTRKRLSFLINPPAGRLLQLVCLLCGLTMPFLELVPFSSSILGAAVTLFAAALIVRDGLLAAAGFLMLGGVAFLALRLF
ncbi:exopolysaccharide biosynthesis protein [uncultured Cohaesibacter sp.]|uniref:exopolysaccharide biosynthesis protein n=1 Tax=uncultured Cohaesibacter sp. TaxID=1002546 RepID=UPI0029C7CA6A|nr:exopolysaccharide biosynthesis protein [uncultured Cohaesibacter sp.]